MATHMKSLSRRAILTEGSFRAAKAYKAKVTSLTSKKVDLQARLQSLTEDVVKHRSDLRYTSTADGLPRVSCGLSERSCKLLGMKCALKLRC